MSLKRNRLQVIICEMLRYERRFYYSRKCFGRRRKQEEIVSKDDEDESRTGSTSEEDEVDKEYGLVYLEAKDKSLPTIGPDPNLF